MEGCGFERARALAQDLTFNYLGTCFHFARMLNKMSYAVSREHIQALQYPASSYIENEFRKKGVPLDKNLMEPLKIVDEGGVYTNLGLLLSDQNTHTMRIDIYDGLDETAALLDGWELNGPVLRHLVRADWILDIYNDRPVLFVDGQSLTLWDYPCDALWEALLNAVMHRDYSVNDASTVISVFENRIEINNAGGLVEGVKREELFGGRPVVAPRNPNLAEVFYRLGAFKKYEGGMSRMRGSCLEQPASPLYGRPANPPQIDVTEDAFRLTLFNANGRTAMKRLEEKMRRLIEKGYM